MPDQHFEILLHLALLLNHLLAFFLQHSVTLLENKNYASEVFLRQHFTCLWIGRHLWTSCGPHFCSAIFRNSFSRCFFCNCCLPFNSSWICFQQINLIFSAERRWNLLWSKIVASRSRSSPFRLVIINQRKGIKEKEITKDWSQSTYFPNRNLQ